VAAEVQFEQFLFELLAFGRGIERLVVVHRLLSALRTPAPNACRSFCSALRMRVFAVPIGIASAAATASNVSSPPTRSRKTAARAR
jgi:hypothetical protein